MLKPGDKAPLFKLRSQKGDEVALSDFAGKTTVILYFYPKDHTSGCTTEACSFRDTIEPIAAKDAVVLGISPDSVRSHQNFIKKHRLNFTLLSDPDHQVATAYDVWGAKKMYGKTYQGILRTMFVIGRNGLIKHVFAKVKPEDHAKEVLGVLE